MFASRPPVDDPADTTGLPASAGGRSKEARGPLDNGQQFGSRYHILRELGIGGMGAVYQAYDQELEVAVALKVIRPEVTQSATAAQDIERRFKQELLLARQVTHKNVVRIHDLGEIDGIKYITMPYIKGSDLATVLRNERLPVSKVMSLAREIAAGMQAAHEAGVVHRDLKPANVMIEGDHAVIMDFGIARSTSRGGPAVSTAAAPGVLDQAISDDVTRYAATIAGEVVGTIEYMAPEQARGEHIDQRADIYAFGLMVYDMLTGRRRSDHAVSAVGELQRRLAQPPPPVRSVVPEVPQALEQLLTRWYGARRREALSDDDGAGRSNRAARRQRQGSTEEARGPTAVGGRSGRSAVDTVWLHLLGHTPPCHARTGDGRDRRLREQHRGFGVRPDAGTDTEAGA